MKPNQSHVAGLELALNALQDAHLWVGSAEVRKLIGQAKASPAAEPAIKESLTVEPMAYAVFADNGNVVCFSTVRDHHSLKALEAAGDAVVSLYTRPQDAELVELLREARELIEHGDFREGYCMCGSAVEAHGFGDGHSPVDALVYYAGQVMERIDAKMASLEVKP